MKKLFCLLTVIFVCGFAPRVFAAATKNTENSAAGLGMVNARVAISDDPAANYYNPAALTTLKATAFTLGIAPEDLTGEFKASRDFPQGTARPELRKGNTSPQILPLAPLPFGYAVYRMKDSPLAFGLGINAPFATGSEFKEDWAGRGQGVLSNILAFAANPNVAWEIVPGLASRRAAQFFKGCWILNRSCAQILAIAPRTLACTFRPTGMATKVTRRCCGNRWT